jgi:hypothetical protein
MGVCPFGREARGIRQRGFYQGTDTLGSIRPGVEGAGAYRPGTRLQE